jgi:hypothetical protein
MANVIRKTYPAGFSTGILILLYGLAFFLSQQIFQVSYTELKDNQHIYLGMFLAATAFIIMVLILWEEILFPIRVKEVNGGMIFHNHRNKIQTQLFIYCAIPAIFVYLYFNFELNLIRFVVMAAICIFLPIVGKISSGLKNYNDFLRVTDEELEYKDNEKVGLYKIKNIETFTIITHEKEHTHQIELLFKDNSKVTIDLHEMELEEYYDYIYTYMKKHYGHMLKEIEME